MSSADLFRPWLAPLMRQRFLCRVMCVAVIIVGGTSWLGLSLWKCPFAEVTGLPCHGCGMTRAFQAMLRGDWHAVMRLHPFAPFFALVGVICSVVAFLPRGLAERLAGQIEVFERKMKIPALILMVFALFGLLRMLGLWYLPPLPQAKGIFKKVSSAVGNHNLN